MANRKGRLLLAGVVLLMVMAVGLSGCGVSQDDYDAAVAERDAAQADVTGLEAQVEDLEDQVATLEDQVAALEAENAAMKAEKLLPDVLTMLGVVDEIEAWNADLTDTALFGALAQAVNGTGQEGLTESWNVFQTASAEGDPGMTLFQFYGHMLGECSKVSSVFPAEVQPLMEVGDEMSALVTALDLALLGQMTEAVNASGHAELTQRWNDIQSTFATDLPAAMGMMSDMQVWMLVEIANAAPSAE